MAYNTSHKTTLKHLKALAERCKCSLDDIMDEAITNAPDFAYATLHNMFVRHKCIGTALSATQSAHIVAGTFDDMWLGDYWTINNVNYMIIDFDYFYRPFMGAYSTAFNQQGTNKHHVVVMAEKPFMYQGSVYVAGNFSQTKNGGYCNPSFQEILLW